MNNFLRAALATAGLALDVAGLALDVAIKAYALSSPDQKAWTDWSESQIQRQVDKTVEFFEAEYRVSRRG